MTIAFLQQGFSLKLACAAAMVVAAFALPARAGIADLAGTKPGELPLGGQFEGADGCALCHGGGIGGDKSYLPHDSWAGTMMGNAARDPVFRAALAIANQDEPGIGTFCLRCHSPIAFVRGHATPPDGSAFDVVDMQGIGCDSCHRAVTSGPADAPYHVGDAQIVYSVDLAKRGPYSDSVAHAHETVADPALSTSHFCGQCHQVTNPGRRLRDSSGMETAIDFPLDTTYQEWKSSSFAGADGAGCIDCHAQRKTGKFAVSTLPGSVLRDNPMDHAFVGANVFGIQAVMQTDPDRAAAYPDAFALAIERTRDVLKTAVRVDIVAAPSNANPGDSMDVTVRVENLAGHKFPTGYAEGRRAWIAISLIRPGGEQTFLLGGYDDEKGEIIDSAKTHVYRAQHGRWNGSAGEPEEDLARHDMIISDSRIPPKGFVAELATTPTTEIDYGNSMVGYRHYDEASFTVSLPADALGTHTLAASVYYQPITRKYVEHLAAANVTDSAGQALLSAYEALGAAPPIVVSTAQREIVIGMASQSVSSSSSSSGVAGAGGAGGDAGAGGSTMNGQGGGEPVKPSGCDCRIVVESNGAIVNSAAWFFAALALIMRRVSSR